LGVRAVWPAALDVRGLCLATVLRLRSPWAPAGVLASPQGRRRQGGHGPSRRPSGVRRGQARLGRTAVDDGTRVGLSHWHRGSLGDHAPRPHGHRTRHVGVAPDQGRRRAGRAPRLPDLGAGRQCDEPPRPMAACSAHRSHVGPGAAGHDGPGPSNGHAAALPVGHVFGSRSLPRLD